MKFEELHVSRSGLACSIFAHLKETPEVRGTADATEIATGMWYLNRVIVSPDSSRGQGLGTQLLKRLQLELGGDANFSRLTVEPGGYSGDFERQARFYTNNGFRPHPATEHTFIWEKSDAEIEKRKTTGTGAPSAG